MFRFQTARQIASRNRERRNGFSRGDAESIVDLYLDEAELWLAGLPPLCGRTAIREFWLRKALPGMDLALVTNELVTAGFQAVETGRYTQVNAAGTVEDRGKYVVFWSRGFSGWRMRREVISSDGPVA